MSTRVLPWMLQQFLRLPPEASLVFLTSTMNTSINWLAAHYLNTILYPPPAPGQQHAYHDNTTILLVSWMRDLRYWKDEIRRGTGVNTDQLTQEGRFSFVDFFKATAHYPDTRKLQDIFQVVIGEIMRLRQVNPGTKIVLILDNPDVIIAVARTNSKELSQLILQLRSQVHSAVVTCSADSPLLPGADRAHGYEPRVIDMEIAAFIAAQAHASSLVISARQLETGASTHISGVLRVTAGGGWYGFASDNVAWNDIKGTEMLYTVNGYSVVKIFERMDRQNIL